MFARVANTMPSTNLACFVALYGNPGGAVDVITKSKLLPDETLNCVSVSVFARQYDQREEHVGCFLSFIGHLYDVLFHYNLPTHRLTVDTPRPMSTAGSSNRTSIHPPTHSRTSTSIQLKGPLTYKLLPTKPPPTRLYPFEPCHHQRSTLPAQKPSGPALAPRRSSHVRHYEHQLPLTSPDHGRRRFPASPMFRQPHQQFRARCTKARTPREDRRPPDCDAECRRPVQ